MILNDVSIKTGLLQKLLTASDGTVAGLSSAQPLPATLNQYRLGFVLERV
jgi:hypothetical protein